MHSNNVPAGVPGTRSDAEPLGAFRLAGFEGAFRGLVTQQDITLERSDGRGIRIAIDSISKVRHQLAPSVPRGFAVLSLIALIAAIRVLVDPLRTLVIALSSLTLMLWLLARRPVLVIDTGEGDRHRMTSDDRVLLKTRLLISRIRDGMTLTEATDGLDDLLDETGFPTIRPVQEEAAALAATLLDDGSDLDAALDRLSAGGRFSDPGAGGPSEARGLGAEALPRQGLFGDSHRARAALAMESERTIREHRDAGNPEPLSSMVGSAWPFGDDGDDPFGSPSFDVQMGDGSRLTEPIGGQVSEPSDHGFGMAMDGDLFGFGDSFSSDAIQPASNDGTGFDQEDPWGSESTTASRLPLPSPPSRPPSSMELIRRARERADGEAGLPPPSAFAVREECLPGLVESARGPEILDAIPLSDFDAAAPAGAADDGPLTAYPSLARLVRTMPRNRRVAPRRASAFGRLAKSVARGVDSMTGRGRSEVDDYATTYGDDEGRGGRSAQFLWLRADQDHQASVAAGAGGIPRSEGGRDPRDAMSEIVRSVAVGERGPPLALPAPGTADGLGAFDSMRATRTGADDEGSIPGIRRLG